MNFLVLNGPNLNRLGNREPDIYGKNDYAALCKEIDHFAAIRGCKVRCFQSNFEGELINQIHAAQGAYDAIILNPGAFTHYSYAIYDALLSVTVPAVEVHISNVYKREEFRRKSVTAPACIGQISGLGFYGYLAAMDYFIGKEN